MSVNWQDIAFSFLGGLGLFLFSIKYMGDGLQQAAGDKLRFYIDKYTSNPFLGVLIGIVMTALIQSSSGVTVIVVGLVSAGLLSLRQAIGIVMGANIGTTVTSFMIGFKLGDYALPVIFLGAAFLFFTSNKKLNNLGRILFGVGGIFFALNLMGDAVEPLKSVTAFKDYLATLGDRPIMGVIIGSGLTMLIQSSAATIGILQSLYSGGLLDLQGALPILFGDNIGTTITAVLAALGSNIAAKRVAGAHVLFNVIGTVLCLVLLVPFTALIQWFKSMLGLTPEMTIAFAHGTFNIANTIVQFPFIGLLAYLVTKIIPGEDEVNKYEALYLDRLLITQAPAIALGNAKKELVHLASYAIQSLEASYAFFDKGDEKYFDKVEKYETAVNSIDEELTTYLIDISNESLSVSENEVLASVLDSVTWSVLVIWQLQAPTFHNIFIIRGLNSLRLLRPSLGMFITVRTVLFSIVFVLLWMMTRCLQVKSSFVMKNWKNLKNNCVKHIPNVLTMVNVLRKQVSTMLITSHITHVSQTMRLTLLKRLQKV